MPVDTNWEFWIVGITLLCGLIILFYWWDRHTEKSSAYKKHILPFILTGPLWVAYHFLTHIGKKNKDDEEPLLVEYAKSFFPILLFVVVLRSFVVEPFRIPSGSMIPTLEIGDFILVKKYAYGIRLPVIHTKIMDTSTPERGDVVVFRFPPNPKINYIKRLIGLPGDKVKWTIDKKLFINGEQVAVSNAGNYVDKNHSSRKVSVRQLNEKLPGGREHKVILFPGNSPLAGEWIVPDKHYFMMGDNRDNSSDGRVWGFVSEKNLVGKASLVWLHWNWQKGGDGFQTDRIGVAVN